MGDANASTPAFISNRLRCSCLAIMSRNFRCAFLCGFVICFLPALQKSAKIGTDSSRSEKSKPRVLTHQDNTYIVSLWVNTVGSMNGSCCLFVVTVKELLNSSAQCRGFNGENYTMELMEFLHFYRSPG